MGGYRNEMPKHDWRVNIFFGVAMALGFLAIGEMIWHLLAI